MNFKTSLLISNILDPLTKTKEDLKELYVQLADMDCYDAIETRIIHDEDVREVFNNCRKKAGWNVTLWLTGEMSRKGLSLSTLDDDLLEKSLVGVYELIDLASLQNCNYIGIASGPIEEIELHDNQIQRFSKSIKKIVDYIEFKYYNMRIVIEPLDQFAHKKNVIGTLSSTSKLIELLKDCDWINDKRISICWDSAHVALNEDDFVTSIRELYPFISRVHFADVVLDKNDEEYGDNHREFDDKGIINERTVTSVLNEFMEQDLDNEDIYVACEVRTSSKEKAWANERKYYKFLQKAILGVKR